MISRICVHSFIADLVRPGGVVLDIGANRGEFAADVRARFGCTVHALEPVPSFHAELNKIPGVTLHPECLASESGTVELHLRSNGDATLYESSGDGVRMSVPSITLDQLVEKVAVDEIDILKLDLEGAELDVLETTLEGTLRRARQITVEFHDWQWPEMTPRVEVVIQRLCDLGFYCIRFSYNNGDILFVRRDLLHPIEYAYLAYIVRNAMGIGRVLRRLVRRRRHFGSSPHAASEERNAASAE